MDADLMEIQKEMDKKQAEQEKGTPAVPAIKFNKTAVQTVPEKETVTDKATELVEDAFSQAIVHKVTTDESVQKELLNSADQVIKNKTNAIKDRADAEEKQAHFNNKKGACECFGYNEATTEKWAVNVMNCWHNVMTAIWLFIGFFTFAPITFVAKKITVIFKKSWIAVTLAIIIYLLFTIGIPLLTVFINK